jgi:hypothetical protein
LSRPLANPCLNREPKVKVATPLVMAHVKSNCEKYTKVLMYELQGKFPNHELKNIGCDLPKLLGSKL